MYKLDCKCGHAATGKDKYAVEAEMWHHGLTKHSDMLTAMSVEQIAGMLRETDQKLAATAA